MLWHVIAHSSCFSPPPPLLYARGFSTVRSSSILLSSSSSGRLLPIYRGKGGKPDEDTVPQSLARKYYSVVLCTEYGYSVICTQVRGSMVIHVRVAEQVQTKYIALWPIQPYRTVLYLLCQRKSTSPHRRFSSHGVNFFRIIQVNIKHINKRCNNIDLLIILFNNDI